MENKTGKYLKYAIGEIVLVVIGILIALQINNWNENRQSTAIELDYLNRLKDSLVEDTVNINFRLNEINQTIDLIDSVTKDSPKNNITEKLSKLLPQLYMITFSLGIETSTFDDLKSTGNLNLIKNKALIKMLSTYYIQTERGNNSLNKSLESYSRNTIGPYIMKNYYITFNVSDFSKEKENQFVLTVNKLKGDLFLVNALGYRKQLLTTLKTAYLDELSQAKNILNVIKEELL